MVEDIDNGKKNSTDDDKLISSYDTILKESAVLTAFSGILFGFILQISINSPISFGFLNKVLILISLYSITIATSLFIMPVIYHHLQYPYKDIQKFKSRSHKFILFGLLHVGITLYLGLVISVSTIFQIYISLILATIPFIIVYIYFGFRKWKLKFDSIELQNSTDRKLIKALNDYQTNFKMMDY